MPIIYYLDLFGTFVFAVSGAVLAMKKKMDVFGVITLGFITAVGGGTLRDLLIGKTPVFWLNDRNYLAVIVIASIGTFLFSASILKIQHILRIADAIGLGTFTIIGLQKGLNASLAPVFAVLMGMITAVVGGATRDVLCREIPFILSREIYATACLSGGLLYFILKSFGVPTKIVIVLSMLLIIAVRLISIKLEWSLPKNEDMKNKL